MVKTQYRKADFIAIVDGHIGGKKGLSRADDLAGVGAEKAWLKRNRFARVNETRLAGSVFRRKFTPVFIFQILSENGLIVSFHVGLSIALRAAVASLRVLTFLISHFCPS
jgi:hypothetical protein